MGGSGDGPRPCPTSFFYPMAQAQKVQYKAECDGCAEDLGARATAFWCASACTWCQECAEGYENVCPTCNGELVRRPRKGPVATAQ